MIKKIKTIAVVIIITLLLPLIAEADICIGKGSSICYPANDLGQLNTMCVKTDTNEWQNSKFYVSNKRKSNDNFNFSIEISGTWQPWGGDSNLTACDCFNCSVDTYNMDMSKQNHCDPHNIDHLPCINDLIESRGQPGVYVTHDIYPCSLYHGIGVYGLIVDSDKCRYDSDECNPNKLGDRVAGDERFFTFHIGDTTRQTRDGNEALYTFGDLDNPSGNLYFKVLGKEFYNHTGEVSLYVNGVAENKPGFISKTMSFIEKIIRESTAVLYQGVVNDVKFINIVRLLLTLYVIITSLSYTLGLNQSNQKEFFVHIFKFAIVVALISPNSWEFFHTYLLDLFTDGAKAVSVTVINAAASVTDVELVSTGNALAIYDNFLDTLTSKALNAKLFSLIFHITLIFWLPLIGVTILYAIYALLGSMNMYILALLQIGFLSSMTPLFMIMILFKATAPLFSNWIKRLTSSALIIILVTATITMLSVIIFDNLKHLVFFPVCWDALWEWKSANFVIFSIKFWIIEDYEMAANALTFANYFNFLIAIVLFKSLIDHVPTTADMLATLNIAASGNVHKAVSKGMQDGMKKLKKNVLKPLAGKAVRAVMGNRKNKSEEKKGNEDLFSNKPREGGGAPEGGGPGGAMPPGKGAPGGAAVPGEGGGAMPPGGGGSREGAPTDSGEVGPGVTTAPGEGEPPGEGAPGEAGSTK